jgi:Tfp pilus assembly PilM family ATPase
VDVGAQQTSFIIVDHGIPLYTSSIPTAGNAFTEGIARSLGVPWAEAEKMKVAHGLVSEAENQETVRGAVLPILDSIIDEVKNVIRFFEEHSTSHHAIDSILLCGGSSRVPGLIEYFSTRINLGSGKSNLIVSQGNPWSNFMSSASKQPLPIGKDQSLGYSTAIGLALRGMDYEAN